MRRYTLDGNDLQQLAYLISCKILSSLKVTSLTASPGREITAVRNRYARGGQALARLLKASRGPPVGRKDKSSLPTNGRTRQSSSWPYTPEDSTKCRPPGVRALLNISKALMGFPERSPERKSDGELQVWRIGCHPYPKAQVDRSSRRVEIRCAEPERALYQVRPG
jgi:hypothetical protein